MTVPAAIAETIDISDESAVEMALEPKVYTFAGLQIAPGPLYYNGTNYEIKDNWNYSSYSTVYGKNEGSTYFSFLDMGDLFEKEGFTGDDGNVDNLLNPLDGWRLPTWLEWVAIFGKKESDNRTGAIVNEQNLSFWAQIHITNSNIKGVLLFPDNEIISGKSLDAINEYRGDNDETGEFFYKTLLTDTELNEYLVQGCIFLPLGGEKGNTWQYGDICGNYWSSNSRSSTHAKYLGFSTEMEWSADEYGYCSSPNTVYKTIRLVRAAE